MKRQNGLKRRTYAVRPECARKGAVSLRSTLLTVAVCIMCACFIGGTLAWLTAQTNPVTNTFTYGKIGISLTETEREYKMVPGRVLPKDPKVTVHANSEDCYLFVKVDESANLDDYISYTVDSAWTALPGEDGVYYREVSFADAPQEFYVLTQNQVTVPTTADFSGLTDNNRPTLTFTAYAVQMEAISSAADAWALIY